jgi:hypothetical protein
MVLAIDYRQKMQVYWHLAVVLLLDKGRQRWKSGIDIVQCSIDDVLVCAWLRNAATGGLLAASKPQIRTINGSATRKSYRIFSW